MSGQVEIDTEIQLRQLCTYLQVRYSLKAFYSCGTQLLLESLLLTAARPEPPDGPLTAIGAAASMPQDGFESPFAPQDLSRSAGSWKLSNGEE